MDDLSGQILKGYEITERIGAGSFGAVYRAHQVSVGREVAIKVILPSYANHPEFIRRFETEAQLVARLEHPHIVPLFDYWREPDCAYLVMRLLPNNLRLALDQGGPLGFDDAARLVDQIASALALSHRQGVVHRDIKPDNILLDDAGNAYLTDFGLAKVIAGSLPDQEDGGVAGSPAYMSPEQLTSDTITPQSDIYALGVVLFELMTGSHPFRNLSMSDMIAKHLLDPLPDLSLYRADLPDTVNVVIQRATAKDPSQRTLDMLALANDFREALLGENEPPSLLQNDFAIENPYKGLRPFEEVDTGDFFGRETLIDQLVASLADGGPSARFLAVVGPSGSGKSSLVKAGLIPALRRGVVPGSERWFVATMVPGQHPILQLETALLSLSARPVVHLSEQLEAHQSGLAGAVRSVLSYADSELLLVIDQFEEVFTLVEQEAERKQFLALLRTAVDDPRSRVRIVVTLRADFYDRPLLYEDFGALMRTRTHVVLPLTTGELERAIVAPAERVGVRLESNLTAAMVADVHEEPGALPLLQYALTEVFERRQGRVMTLEGYEAIGRAAGALARRAERVYTRLDPGQQAVARQIFLRLVTLGEGSEDIRRRTDQSELASIVPDHDLLQEVLDIFGRHRLLSFDHALTTREPTVEVAHEALIREWGRLREWLDASREDVRQQRRLARLGNEWLANAQDPSYLLRGVQLEQFEQWMNQTSIALSDVERAYLDASIQVRETQRELEQSRRAHEAALEARARRFQRVFLVLMFVATLIALVLSAVAFDQRTAAHRARRAAERSADLAQTEASSAATAAAVAERRANEIQSLALAEDAKRAVDRGDADLGLALALAANQIPDPPVQAQNTLSTIANTAAVRVFDGASASTVIISPNSTQAISGGDDGTLTLWNLATGDAIRTFSGHSGKVRGVAFTPDGTQVLSASEDDTLILWDVESGSPVRTLTGHADDVFAVAISPDGTQAISGARDHTLILWDLQTGAALRRFGESGHTERITCVAFGPNGQWAVSGSADHTLIVWDVATGTLLGQLTGHTDGVTDVAVSPDGRTVLSASADTTMILWDTASYMIKKRLEAHTERVMGVAFSPDGRKAISGAGNPFAGASTDNSLILWDLQLGQPIRRYQGHRLHITDVAFSPDGSFVLSASADDTLRLWAVEFDMDLLHRRVGGLRIDALAFDPGGQFAVAALSNDGVAQIDLAATATDPREFPDRPHTARINAVALSPDGTQALTAAADRTLVLWDIASGQALRTFTGHTNFVNDVAFSPNGTQALSGSRDRDLILWDIPSGQALRVFDTHHTNAVNAVAFSPDGTQALSASADQTLILWDVATGQALATWRGHSGSVLDAAFSPDGTQAISGSLDKTVILWDVATGSVIRQLGTESGGHTDWVTAVAFSADGRRLISGSRDRSVRLWDAASGELLQTYAAYTDTVLALQSGSAGEVLDTASAEGMIRVLPASIDTFIDWVTAHRTVRALSCSERDLYHLGECE